VVGLPLITQCHKAKLHAPSEICPEFGSSIEIVSLPTLREPCGFAFCVTHSIRSIPEFLNSPLVSGRALADSKKGDPLSESGHARKQFFSLLSSGRIAKTLPRNKLGEGV
jgi:hypothetical protein